ncbi:udp-3-o-(3-hydroxymyristoyl) glucosamine n-acyltransferase [Diplodia corticola]|uniref:Udp-3-o-(3-hydroxymyristoyl) glucosamine n-acyltransferase n=1 Tax=Diplodia corticola TaxID=236234 RepID=A0A1J9QW23_9PEZI|nr:udp-3-o-(3-hydroxymyristoyl) glucosamine n-acyltransferase [Diplodia corticola]OJD32616.1 udp-3-o-(3-hydroxymyristoyl) glucosamine n-acyltransferase [Diplodia corticola]
MTFQSVDRLLSLGLVPLGRTWHQISCVCVLMLLFPAQWSTPLASGAISWLPALNLQPSNITASLPVAGFGPPLVWFNLYGEARETVKQRAQGVAVTLNYPSSFYRPVDGSATPSRRRVDSLRQELQDGNADSQQIPLESRISNATLPYFRMESIEWLDDQPAFHDFFNSSRSLGSFTNLESSPYNVLMYGIRTETAILDWNLRLNLGDLPTWPSPTTINATYTLAVMVSRRENQPEEGTCLSVSPTYGHLPPKQQFRLTFYNEKTGIRDENCYMFANVTVAAGVVHGQQCPLVSSGVIEHRAADASAVDIHPHPLVAPAFRILPEILFGLAEMNATNGPTWDNLSGHVVGSWSLAFQATWNALNDWCETGAAAAAVRVPVPSVRAQVARERIGGKKKSTRLSQLHGE